MKEILCIADPISKWNPTGETTFFLLSAAQKLGLKLWLCELQHLEFKNGEWLTHAVELHMKPHKKLEAPFEFDLSDRSTPRSLTSFHSVHLRKDPPVDPDFIHHLQFLTNLESQVLFFNTPSCMLKWNEKLSILQFPDLILPTFVHYSHHQENPLYTPMIRKFLDDAQGRGVRLLQQGPLEAEARYVMDQEFNKEIEKGDKRILLFEGDYVGHFIRMPKKGQFLANLRYGATVEASTLTKRDKEIIRRVGEWAKKQSIFFIGLDVIGDFLSEVNMTSVRGIRELIIAGGPDLSEDYWSRVLRH